MPGDAGDNDWQKLAKKLAAEQLGFLFGLFVGARGGRRCEDRHRPGDHTRDYSGPAGLRIFSDMQTFAKQSAQDEFDQAFRKAAINLTGNVFALPSAQINRSITGAQALADGYTSNPAAPFFGFQKPR